MFRVIEAIKDLDNARREVQVALSILRERINMFSYHVALPTSTDEDQLAYDAFLHEHNLTQIQAEAEFLLHTLQVNYNVNNDTLHQLHTHGYVTAPTQEIHSSTSESTPQRSSGRQNPHLLDDSVERRRPPSRSCARSRSRSLIARYDASKCCFCDSSTHLSIRCNQRIQSSAHGHPGSRDYSRDHNRHLRESSSHTSRSESTSRCIPNRVSPSPERHPSGSPHPGIDSLQHSVGIDEHVDYVDCFTQSQFASSEQKSCPITMVVKTKVRDLFDQLQDVTILIDTGSQFSFITTMAANKLGFHDLGARLRKEITYGGNQTTGSSGVSPNTITGIHRSIDEDEEDIVSRLSNSERLGITDHPHEDDHTTVDTRVLEDFEGTFQESEGYLYIGFPWKTPYPQLGDNKQLAFCQLFEQYHSLHQNPAVWSNYCAAIQQHLDSGFIEEASEYVYDSPLVYYIPHQAVYEESSTTTKLRVVFNASSHMKGVHSLNNCLYEGPLPDITGILIRAHLHRYLLTADVEKALHQISQRDVTRFLWLKDPSSPPSKEYASSASPQFHPV
ncbi:hypothetical protein ANCDUO_18528 [Ancylostoma duodenale]|uniref:Peptidase aspartic putative domain-containing protein n=1 Tax=Ancylostoma duodenale TaxID=51022 RepID=A0A0C2CNS8_9BILA|nr:hypothetical protein ANCDUO_18528 [Ancylostoma duodenale]